MYFSKEKTLMKTIIIVSIVIGAASLCAGTNGQGGGTFQDVDLLLFIEHWLQADCVWPDWCEGTDFNTDGTVNLVDFSIVSEHWLMSVDPNLVGQWTFEETEGLLAGDETAYGNHGILFNSPVWTGTGELSLDGIDDYVEVPDSNSLMFTAQITISVWVQLTDNDDRFMKIVIQPSSIDSYDPWENYCIDIRRKNPRFMLSTGVLGSWAGAFDTTYNSPLMLSMWYHLVGTYDGTTMILYVNGQPTKSAEVSLMIGNNNLPLFFGGRWNKDCFSGLLDEVRIYKRALSESEVKKLYQGH
jgi:hypothetical protein